MGFIDQLKKRMEVPQKGGSSSSEVQYNYSVKFLSIEGFPEYEISQEFTIGSEKGDLVIADCGLAPKHITFLVQEGALLLIDLAGEGKTLLNNSPLPLGKKVFVEAQDELRLNDLVLKIFTQAKSPQKAATAPTATMAAAIEKSLNKPQEISQEISHEKSVEKTKEFPPLAALTPDIPSAQSQPVKNPKIALEQIAKKQSQSKIKQKKSLKSKIAVAGPVSRILGLVYDVLLSLLLYMFLQDQLPFQQFLIHFSQSLVDFFQITETHPLASLYEILGVPNIKFVLQFVGLEDLVEFLAPALVELGLLILHMLFFSLVMGVSLGSWLAGLRSHHQGWKKNLIGPLREAIGFILWPFLIFDLPALFSRRTAKEVLTGSPLVAIGFPWLLFSHLVSFPLLLVSLVFLPLLKESSFSEPRPVQHLKIKLPTLHPNMPGTQPPATQPSDINNNNPTKLLASYEIIHSQHFNIQLAYDKQTYLNYPRFHWSVQSGQRLLGPQLDFFVAAEPTEKMTLTIGRRFDWTHSLQELVQHNPLLTTHVPKIHSWLTHQLQLKQVELKQRQQKLPTPTAPTQAPLMTVTFSDKDYLLMHEELTTLLEDSYKLSWMTSLEHLEKYGPWLRPWVQFRKRLNQDLGLKADAPQSDFSLLTIGKKKFLRVESKDGFTQDTLVVLDLSGLALTLQLQYSSQRMKEKHALPLLKQLAMFEFSPTPEITVEASNIPPTSPTSPSTANVGQLIDGFYQDPLIHPQSLDQLFIYSLHRGKETLLQKENTTLHKIYSDYLVNMKESLLELARLAPRDQNTQEQTSETYQKYHQKLLEVEAQFKAGNLEYFGGGLI
jgi:hypothetical protein